MNKLLLIALCVSLASCSGVSAIRTDRKVADNIDTSKLYTQDFLQKISLAKEKIRQGKIDLALKDLTKISDSHLTNSEIATKQNLIGVVHFSQKKYDLAIKQFEQSLTSAKDDPALESQVLLNLGSSYYKQTNNEKAFSILGQCNFKNLQDSEAKKFHQLYALLSQNLGKQEQGLNALIRSLEEKNKVSDIISDQRYSQIENLFNKLSESEKVRLLEDFDQDSNATIAYLAYKEAENAYKKDEKSKVKDYSIWIEKRYSTNTEIMNLVSSLGNRNENNNQKIDARFIGVILPLSGDSKGLGERALAGIDVALSSVVVSEGELDKKYKMEIKDSKGSSANGVFAVRELVEQNNVSAIIGGLNSAEATKEYLEAKKYGVVFISLSKVLLPKEEKNYLLIEVPGSIESQVHHLFSEKILSKIGQRPAILYPKNEIGEAYANEFWRQSKKNNLDVAGLVSFDPAQTDFRDPVKNILGIKFEREREDELAIVSDIAMLESKKNIKRLQNLQPQIDFDWIFVPALPRESVQVLPNFNFFDAFKLNYVGVPSWRSELMLNEGYRYGNVFFIDEFSTVEESEFAKKYVEKFGKKPNFVETIAYDSLKIMMDIVESEKKITTRQDLDLALAKKTQLTTESGSWKLVDDIWIKDLSAFRIKREGFGAFEED